MKPLLAALLAAAILGAAPARADIPNPDECRTVGEPCQNAPPDFDKPGRCASVKCRRPCGESNCTRCGAADAAPTPPTPPPPPAPTVSTSTPKRKSGCSLAAGEAPASTLPFLALALAA